MSLGFAVNLAGITRERAQELADEEYEAAKATSLTPAEDL